MGAMRISVLFLTLGLLTFASAKERYPLPPAPKELKVPPPEAQATPSGLATLVLKEGTGKDHPKPGDLVTVEFTLWFHDGKVIDSSSFQPEPLTLPSEKLVKGMREGLLFMVAGEKRRMWVPASMAFQGSTYIPNGALVLDVELLAFEPSPYPAPPDLAGPSGDAKVLFSGLGYRFLRRGTGTEHPSRVGHVRVHYTGWTQDGVMFDSSYKTGEPAVFGLDQVIKGWTEGLQLMAPGDRIRLWVPEKMAYQGAKGKPAGMLVFDIDLIAILI
jgi:peptidylprolyl isomerase